ncbi:MAG: hypothetical protein CMG66_06345 [Candidatus Marinimicrobia bacterium]|nr:hypothetical protein [Candidatus Neomarinimicrobiota bacterium]|tara:strand:+ start:20304 stop:21209 length:906 start_codon:yes stop_codon:yes gene_type:complete
MKYDFSLDFFIIGAQKSGTSTLHQILKQTNLVSLPKNKETHYFSYLINKNKDFRWYKKQFDIKKKHQILGEVDPSYMYIKNTSSNIKKNIKSPKIVIILRKPIERAFSHYLMSYRRGLESKSFIEGILDEPVRLKIADEFSLQHFSYLDRGNYAKQIKEYQKLFNDSLFLFLKFDDLLEKNSKKKLIVSLFSFLNIDFKYDNFNFDEIHMNKSKLFRFRWIQNILYGKSYLRRLLSKLLINDTLRYKIKQKIEKMNLKEISSDFKDTIPENFPDKIVRWNNQQVYELEKVTKLNLKNWIIK